MPVTAARTGTFRYRYCFPWLILATTVTRQLTLQTSAYYAVNMTSGATVTIESCTFSLPRRHYVVYYVADFVLFYVTPLLVACVLYALIGRTLLRRGVDGTSRSTLTRRVNCNGVGVETSRSERRTRYGTGVAASVAPSTSSSRNTLVIVVHADIVTRPSAVPTIVYATDQYHSNGGDHKV